MANTEPNILINAQYLKDLSFEHAGAPQSLLPGTPPAVELNVNIAARPVAPPTEADGLHTGTHEVLLQIRATARRTEGEAVEPVTIFIVEVSYAGLFTLENIPLAEVEPLLLIEAPRQLFPFARAIAANCTRDGGLAPLMINPVNFVQLYEQRQRENVAG